MPEECANPLLLGWLKEWMDEAQGRNSKGYIVYGSYPSYVNEKEAYIWRSYKKAFQSMKACPLTFSHPSEAQQLNGLGPKLCDRLADKLERYCLENDLPMPQKAIPQSKRRQADETEQSAVQPAKKTRKAQLYVPKLRSGAYALIMALGELDQDGSQALSKTDLIEKAQPYCDASFSVPSDPTKFYTAWQSMKTLENKELVCIRGHPTKRYYLSDEGWEVAIRIRSIDKGNLAAPSMPGDNIQTRSDVLSTHTIMHRNTRRTHTIDVVDLSSSPEPESNLHTLVTGPPTALQVRESVADTITNDNASTSPIVLPSGTFDVQLVLDTREIRTKNDRDYLSRELQKLDVVPDIRALPLGDVLWIAKIREPYKQIFKSQNAGDDEEGNTEIVLEHVIERKRLDDLIGSIKDGRFHEQKFRLRKSGMRNITYLIEDYSISAERSEKYGEAVESAIASMQVVNDIFVKQTSKIDDTIQYLARMTKTLQGIYDQKDLHVIPSRTLDIGIYLNTLENMRDKEPEKSFCITFSAFCSLCDKSDSMTLRDVFLKMLMCTRGVTGDKAVEIQKIWKTPQALVEAYEMLGSDTKKKESMISDRLSDAIARKKVAKTLSAKIGGVWAG